MDIIVTTPKSQMATAAQEAENVKASGGGIYFRCLGRHRPEDLGEGDRIFYVEDGFIRGFATVMQVTDAPGMICSTTDRQFPAGWYVFSDAETWQWIKPIAMRGFQGWRYFEAPETIEVVGGWLDERPFRTIAGAGGMSTAV